MSEIGHLSDQNIVYSSEYIRCFISHIDFLCKRNMHFFFTLRMYIFYHISYTTDWDKFYCLLYLIFIPTSIIL